MAQRNSNTSAVEFNRLFTPNTPCFYRPVRTEDKWYPTRTRSEAWFDEYLNGLVVRIDGSSAAVLVTQLAMPGSSLFDGYEEEANQVWEDWVNQLADTMTESAPAPAVESTKPMTVTRLMDDLYAKLLEESASADVLNLVGAYKVYANELQTLGQITDGYHTFGELYQHRVRLFTCLMHAHKNRAWWSHKHSDGSQWDGWIIAGILTPRGMVSYHLPVTEIPFLPDGIELEEGRLWDGHTAEDVLARLPALNFGQTDGTAITEPVEDEQAVYQYVAAVATPNGFIHYDGILHGPMISGIEDYHRYRAEMASDAGVQPEQIQVRSLAIVGMSTAAAPSEANHGNQEDA